MARRWLIKAASSISLNFSSLLIVFLVIYLLILVYLALLLGFSTFLVHNLF